jgi:uncharacterized protein YbjQ (UPF0145 family)
MGEIIITTSDKVPKKRIVKVLGNVYAQKAEWFSPKPNECFEELKKKAKLMGADAVINAVYTSSGTFGVHGSCSGIAVKLEDSPQNLCPKCKKELPEGSYSFCPHCGASVG